MHHEHQEFRSWGKRIIWARTNGVWEGINRIKKCFKLRTSESQSWPQHWRDCGVERFLRLGLLERGRYFVLEYWSTLLGKTPESVRVDEKDEGKKLRHHGRTAPDRLKNSQNQERGDGRVVWGRYRKGCKRQLDVYEHAAGDWSVYVQLLKWWDLRKLPIGDGMPRNDARNAER